jgi:branched-chain amino acid transport system permease protein
MSFEAVVVLAVTLPRIMGIFNFAHGELVLLGAYTRYLAYSFRQPVWFGMLAAPLVVAVIAFVRFYAAPVAAALDIRL